MTCKGVDALGRMVRSALVVAVGTVSLLLSSGSALPQEAQTNPAEMLESEFDRRVRKFLLDHPEVILESVRRFEESREQAAQSEARSVITTRADEIFRDAASPVGGNPEGNATLVEFFDYNCPYCRRVAPIMVDAKKADPQLRIVYKEFPILGPNSTAAAKVALAAHRQGKYAAFHEALMQHKGTTGEQAALAVAAELGLDMARLKIDMDIPEIAAAIDRNIALAEALRINGTPSFVIGEQIIPGAVDLKTLQTSIEAARRPKQGSQQ